MPKVDAVFQRLANHHEALTTIQAIQTRHSFLLETQHANIIDIKALLQDLSKSVTELSKSVTELGRRLDNPPPPTLVLPPIPNTDLKAMSRGLVEPADPMAPQIQSVVVNSSITTTAGSPLLIAPATTTVGETISATIANSTIGTPTCTTAASPINSLLEASLLTPSCCLTSPTPSRITAAGSKKIADMRNNATDIHLKLARHSLFAENKSATNRSNVVLFLDIDEFKNNLGVVFFKSLYARLTMNPSWFNEQKWVDAQVSFVEMNILKCERKIFIFDPGDKVKFGCSFAVRILHGDAFDGPVDILVLMGPSGSVKTTLLQILGARLNGDIKGCITFNDTPYVPHLKRRIGFVTQDDVLFPHLTVGEILVFVDFLRLPSSMTRQQKYCKVEAVIKESSLERCRHSRVRGSFVKGTSGGKRRRTSIGYKILVDPSIFLCDEPTSGLDSTSASKLLHVLQNLARAGWTVITIIHQPSSRMFYMFDKLLLISDGYPIYHGRARGSMHYFASLGFVPEPAMKLAEFLLDLAIGQVDGITMPETLQAYSNPQECEVQVSRFLQAKYIEEIEPRENIENQMITKSKQIQLAIQVKRVWAINWSKQFSILLKRTFTESSRDHLDNLRLMQAVGLAIFLGLLWWKSNIETEARLRDQGAGVILGAAVLSIKRAGTIALLVPVLFLLTGRYYVQHILKFVCWMKYIYFMHCGFKLLLMLRSSKDTRRMTQNYQVKIIFSSSIWLVFSTLNAPSPTPLFRVVSGFMTPLPPLNSSNLPFTIVSSAIITDNNFHLANHLSTIAYSHNLDESKPLIFDPGGKIDFECFFVVWVHDDAKLNHSPGSTKPIPQPPTSDLEDKVVFEGSVMIRLNMTYMTLILHMIPLHSPNISLSCLKDSWNRDCARKKQLVRRKAAITVCYFVIFFIFWLLLYLVQVVIAGAHDLSHASKFVRLGTIYVCVKTVKWQ